jgi:hypothetical protein
MAVSPGAPWSICVQSRFHDSNSVKNGLFSTRNEDGTNSAICHYMGQDPDKPLTSHQVRAARALLRWSAEDLSRQSSVSLRTIRRAELAELHTAMTTTNNLAIRRALESAGVEFIDENGGGHGVRLRKRQRAKRF